MKILRRILLIGLVCLVLLIVAGVIVSGLLIGKIAKKAVETVGPQVTKTTVRVEDVKVSLLNGAVSIRNFSVGNPEGYSPTNAFYLGSASVAIEPGSLLSDKIVIKHLRIESPEIVFEGNPLGENNLKKLLENVSGGKEESGVGKKEPAQPSKKLQVNELVIVGAKVHLGNGTTLTLPDIKLRDLGTGPEGITPANLAKQIIAQVGSDTLKAVGESITDLGKSAEKIGRDTGEKLRQGLGSLLRRSTN